MCELRSGNLAAALGVCAAGILALPLAAQPAGIAPSANNPPAASPTSPCGAPVGELSFVCGAQHPEDLAHIPGTRFLIASGFATGAGLKLVDTDAKTLRLWYGGTVAQIRPDPESYPDCSGPPDAAVFNAHGINLKPRRDGTYTLYVVNHGGRQSIEIFIVDPRPAEPSLIWTGCIPMPAGSDANSVAAYGDGTVIASVQLMNGKTLADSVNGIPTGGVFEWTPGGTGWHLLAGTAVPGNNGIETGRNDKEFYLIGFGVHIVYVYDRHDTGKPLRQSVAPDFMPDNLHWDDGRLIAAGMISDEPACGGPRKVVDGRADPMRCPRGFKASALDPATMIWSTIAYGTPNPAFNGVSAAVVMGGNVWLGSYQADRLAWLPVPRLSGP